MLFPNTKILEDNRQQIIHRHTPRNTAKGAESETGVFGAEFGDGGGERLIDMALSFLERLAVALAGEGRGAGVRHTRSDQRYKAR